MSVYTAGGEPSTTPCGESVYVFVNDVLWQDISYGGEENGVNDGVGLDLSCFCHISRGLPLASPLVPEG